MGTRNRPARVAPKTVGFWKIAFSTLPLFIVLCYFLFSAAIRPGKPLYQVEGDDDYAIKEAMENTPGMIPLYDMCMVFLSFEALFIIFTCYLTIFVSRRQLLVASYLEMGESCLGDVIYEHESDNTFCKQYCGCGCCNRPPYGEVEYAYPNTTQWTVQKKVRVHNYYSRERVTLMRLLNRPFSAQPRSDLEVDLEAAQAAKHNIRHLTILCIIWVIFLLLSPLFIMYKMTKLRHDAYEDARLAFKVYLIFGIAVIPVVCTLGVLLRWTAYRHWVVNQGHLVKVEDSNREAMAAQDEGFVGVFLNELTGQNNPHELASGETTPGSMGASFSFAASTGSSHAQTG